MSLLSETFRAVQRNTRRAVKRVEAKYEAWHVKNPVPQGFTAEERTCFNQIVGNFRDTISASLFTVPPYINKVTP